MNKLICILGLVAQLIVVESFDPIPPTLPPPECGENEVYLEFGPPCPQQCKVRPRECLPGGSFNMSGCYCIDGYVRYKGMCRDAKKVCCPKNEVFDCGSACQNECSKLGEVCPIQTLVCVENCFCIPGYARDVNGKCIPESRCPIIRKCKDSNEHYVDECGRCVCNKGFVRNKNGKCVREILIRRCRKPNEHYEIECGKCVCNPGYVRNKKGNCVKQIICNSSSDDGQVVCKQNECYQTCGNSCQGTCANPDLPQACLTRCRPGCFCQDGYLFDEKANQCVSPSDCGQITT